MPYWLQKNYVVKTSPVTPLDGKIKSSQHKCVNCFLWCEWRWLLYVKLTTSPMWLVHRHTFINALPKNSCFLLSTFVFTVTLSPSYSLIQIDITVTASDGDCYLSNFRPRQCGLFIVILSSTLSLKTVHRTVFLTVAFKSRHTAWR